MLLWKYFNIIHHDQLHLDANVAQSVFPEVPETRAPQVVGLYSDRFLSSPNLALYPPNRNIFCFDLQYFMFISDTDAMFDAFKSFCKTES
jgi:hypothetical protein